MRFLALSTVCTIVISALAVASEAKIVEVIMIEVPTLSFKVGPRFEPPNVEINVGDTVRWTNKGGITHTVDEGKDCKDIAARALANTQVFSSKSKFPGGAVPPGGVYEHKFETAGEFTYFCLPHCAGSKLPQFGPVGPMRGEVTVK
ncbi:hypothetical protein BG004_007449 [Podila humilis]|nr:hypothetical protein BG004_007449 [Podila humilis]